MGNMTEKYTLDMTFLDFYEGLVDDNQFREHVINIFKQSSLHEAFWEFPAYGRNSYNDKAEFVLNKSPRFPPSNPETFREHFKGKIAGDIVQFKNISRDADLISICPSGERFDRKCSDIMAFMKSDNELAKHNLLIKIGQEMVKHTNSTQKKYLSTHGFGVSWLHVRICDTPKYYSHDAYK